MRLITRKNNLKKLARMAAKLEKTYSEYGYFQEQGIHQESGLSYPYLMSIHEWGTANGHIPARKPFSIAIFGGGQSLLKALKRPMAAHVRSATRKVNYPVDQTLEIFGSVGVYMTKGLFGSSTLLSNAPSTIRQKGFDAPLVETGDLRDNMRYRTSENKRLR